MTPGLSESRLSQQSLKIPPPEAEHSNYLQQILSSNSTEILEEGKKTGLEVVDILREPLELAASIDDSTQAANWVRVSLSYYNLSRVENPTFRSSFADIPLAWHQIQALCNLKERVQPSLTIIGVVGNTGAGKSSVISAVLDEERLLPTNCMRACTASPTEISYNYSDDPEDLYRAEVEFLTAEEWTRELEALFADLLDGNGEVSRDSSNQDSEAGIAYAKIKAVYPKKTKEQISRTNARGSG